jgi:hypothetical protein
LAGAIVSATRRNPARQAVGSMYRLKAQAQALMQMPTEDGMTTAGPTFEYVPPSEHDRSEGTWPDRNP